MADVQYSGCGRYDNPGYYPGVIDLCAPIPLHRQSGIPGKVPGALLVARGIKNCVPLLHAPVGCAFQRKVNPFRPWDIFFDTPCSRITEVETVYGGNDRLSNAIKAVAEKYRPDLILVISTCAPDLIGDDFAGVIREVRQEIPCEVIYTTGNAGRQPVGVQDALTSLIDQLVDEPVEKLAHGVNICTLPAHNATFKIAELKALLEEIGAEINGIYFIDSTVDQIRKLSRAKMNITDYRQEWCRRAEEKFGMKSLALNQFQFESLDDSPGTVSGTVKLLQHIARELDLGEPAYAAIKRKERQVEDELAPWREKLQGKRIAMSFFLHGGAGPLLVKELGMECGVLIIKTAVLTRSLKRKAAEEMIQRMIDFLRRHQRSAPVVLFDPTPEEELAAIKQNNIDLAVCGLNAVNLGAYLRHGIRVFDEGRFTRHQVRVGFEFVLNLAKEAVRVLERPVPGEPLLFLLDYSAGRERSHLTKYWAKIVDCFQSVWFYDVREKAGEKGRK